jgi:hypothetical protein
MMLKFAFTANTAITINSLPAMMAAVRGAMSFLVKCFCLIS